MAEAVKHPRFWRHGRHVHASLGDERLDMRFDSVPEARQCVDLALPEVVRRGGRYDGLEALCWRLGEIVARMRWQAERRVKGRRQP